MHYWGSFSLTFYIMLCSSHFFFLPYSFSYSFSLIMSFFLNVSLSLLSLTMTMTMATFTILYYLFEATDINVFYDFFHTQKFSIFNLHSLKLLFVFVSCIAYSFYILFVHLYPSLCLFLLHSLLY